MLPLLKRAGAEAGREAISTGARILDKINQPEGNITKPELVTELKKGADNLLERGGLGRHFGTGYKRKGNHMKQSTLSNINIIGKRVVPSKVKRTSKSRSRDVFSHGLF
jgi:hypothetical protein